MGKVKGKRVLFWLILILINLVALEALLSMFFFQSKSKYPLAIYHYGHSLVKDAINRGYIPGLSIGIWQRDPKLGYAHRANSTGTHWKPDFDVTYTIGDDKERFIPRPDNPVGQILFLGGSFTFGHGVDDDQTYPYVLGRQYWTNWHIVNKAVMGWGTSHAYLVVSDELEKDTLPSTILYAMIPHHITRNYIRRSWVEMLAKSDRDHPHFELVNGHLQFQGVVNVANSLQDSPAVRKRELELTSAYLVGIQTKCEQKNIPFIVVLQPQKNDAWPPYVVKTLIEHNIPFLDLSEMILERFPTDPHPNAEDHKLLAEAISRSFISDVLERLTEE